VLDYFLLFFFKTFSSLLNFAILKPFFAISFNDTTFDPYGPNSCPCTFPFSVLYRSKYLGLFISPSKEYFIITSSFSSSEDK